MSGSRPRAILFTLGVPLVLLGITFAMVDTPIFARERAGGAPTRAVVALRDPVHPVETFGTWGFMLPLLEQVYDEVHPITQAYDPDPPKDEGRFPSIFRPTLKRKKEFLAALRGSLERCDVVDLFIVSHTNYTYRWLGEIPAEQRKKIRLVYNSGCRCGNQKDEWMKLGVRTYVAHPVAASHAHFFVGFVRRWAAGMSAAEAAPPAAARSDRFFWVLDKLIGASLQRERWLKSHPEITGDPDVAVGEVAK